MTVNNFKQTEDFFVSFEFECKGKEWEAFVKPVSANLQKRKPISGYRSGKAPLSVAAAHYGNELFGIAYTRCLNDFLPKICEERDLAPVSEPNSDILHVDVNGLTARCTFYSYPTIPDYDYHGVTVERPVKTVTEKDVDEALDKYMRNHLYVHEVQRPAQMNDIVEIDFIGQQVGGSFKYDRVQKCRITMGYEELFHGLDEQLIGHSGGDRLEIRVENPKGFKRPSVSGMTLDLVINVHGVWARDRVECTDEYCRDNIHIDGINTVADFRAKLRRDLEKDNESNSNDLLDLRIEKALASTVHCAIPEVMMDVLFKNRIETLDHICKEQGITVQQALDDEGIDGPGFLEMCRPNVEEQLKQTIAIDHIIRKEHLAITMDELKRHLSVRMSTNNLTLDEAAEQEGGKEEVFEKMLHAKAVSVFRDSVTVVDVPVDEFPTE